MLCISETLLYHSAYIYVKLSSSGIKNSLRLPESGVNARRYALYHKLPDEFDKSVYDRIFDKSVYDRIVSEMNENASTAYKWIDKFIQDGRLKRTCKGYYVKI